MKVPQVVLRDKSFLNFTQVPKLRYPYTVPTYTVNPLYTDTRYNDKIHYNNNLTSTKPSLKRRQLILNYANKFYLVL